MILDYVKRIGVVLLFSFVLLMIMNGLTIAISGVEANGSVTWSFLHDTPVMTLNSG